MIRYIATTQYAGPTDTRGARVLVYIGSRKAMTMPWNHALGLEENHQRAVQDAIVKIEGGAPGKALVSLDTVALPDACNHQYAHVVKYSE